MRRIRGGVPALPALVLSGAAALTQLELVAFGTLAPQIRDAFGLTDAQFTATLSAGLLVAFAGLLAMGALADRRNRRRLALASFALWAIAAALAGLATGLAVLLLARVAMALGSLANEPVHASLLADSYPRPDHSRVFALHEGAYSAAEIAGPLAGLIAAAVGWRGVLLTLAVLGVLLLAALHRVAEPERPPSPHVPADGTRTILRSPAMRRILSATALTGLALGPISALLSFFLEHDHGVGPYGRGLIGIGVGAGGIAGLALGAALAGRAAAAGAGALIRLIGLLFLAGASALTLMAALPHLAVAVTGSVLAAIFLSGWTPAYWALLGRLLPSHLRGRGAACATLAIAIGGLPAFLVSDLGDRHGYTSAFAVLAAVTALAAGIVCTAARHADTEDTTGPTPQVLGPDRPMADTSRVPVRRSSKD
ncbi:MFS transporter [Actinomadura rubrisoli]|uniref:MFS transporter n=1 Tax=Actinomadura rubrisoli TaxID=2530368 RepID=A0A4R5C5R4_9ACTN|nr:MFS transporter [Actinomadura rubrisoli]TDD93443.1 MFS transporter [Actinomadura rubrisoli]